LSGAAKQAAGARPSKCIIIIIWILLVDIAGRRFSDRGALLPYFGQRGLRPLRVMQGIQLAMAEQRDMQQPRDRSEGIEVRFGDITQEFKMGEEYTYQAMAAITGFKE
jgi:hypothetical protein